MKLYKLLLLVTLFFAIYPWFYDVYLHENVYVRYLPNYKIDVPVETFDLSTKEGREGIKNPSLYESNVPLYGKLLHNIVIPIYILTPVLLIICFLIAIYLTIKYKRFNNWKWLALNFSIFLLILFVFKYFQIKW